MCETERERENGGRTEIHTEERETERDIGLLRPVNLTVL